MSSQKNNLQKGGYLTEDQINEQLLNDDLKNLGINKDELDKMEMQEKQNLLTALKQSTSPQPTYQISRQQHYGNRSPSATTSTPKQQCGNRSPSATTTTTPIKGQHSLSYTKNKQTNIKKADQFQDSPNASVVNKVIPLDNRIENKKAADVESSSASEVEIALDSHEHFPNLSQMMVKKQLNIRPKEEDDIDMDDDDGSEDEECISDDEHPFKIPGFIDDDGQDLTHRIIRNSPGAVIVRPFVEYYTRPHTTNGTKEMVKLMLKYYNIWYSLCPSLKNCILPKQAVISETVLEEHVEEDSSSSSITETNVFSPKVLNNQLTACTSTGPWSPSLRRDDTDMPKKTENVVLEVQQKSQTMPRETRTHQNPGQSSAAIIELTSDNKWDPQTGVWTTERDRRRKSNNRTRDKVLNNKKNELSNVEAKVQCPICQLDFPLTKVESHAALCEGFPTETRLNKSEFSKLDDKKMDYSQNETSKSTNNGVVLMDLTENNDDEEGNNEDGKWKMARKRRGN